MNNLTEDQYQAVVSDLLRYDQSNPKGCLLEISPWNYKMTKNNLKQNFKDDKNLRKKKNFKSREKLRMNIISKEKNKTVFLENYDRGNNLTNPIPEVKQSDVNCPSLPEITVNNKISESTQVNKENLSIISQLKEYKFNNISQKNQCDQRINYLIDQKANPKMSKWQIEIKKHRLEPNIVSNLKMDNKKEDNLKNLESTNVLHPLTIRSTSTVRSKEKKLDKFSCIYLRRPVNKEDLKKFQNIINDIINNQKIPRISHSINKNCYNRRIRVF